MAEELVRKVTGEEFLESLRAYCMKPPQGVMYGIFDVGVLVFENNPQSLKVWKDNVASVFRRFFERFSLNNYFKDVEFLGEKLLELGEFSFGGKKGFFENKVTDLVSDLKGRLTNATGNKQP